MTSFTDTVSSSAVRHIRDFLLPAAVLISILLIIVPLPVPVIDILLSFNITLSVLILMTTIFVRTPLEFSTFPTVLLSATLFRLGLNVATTRMILSHAETDGMLAAGHVVRAFSGFVADGNLAVGAVIFLIIIIIQFVVITKGATRISEVSARFVLDGLPGKQMAIDADIQSGALTQAEGREKRNRLADEVDFYGSMDGASKFVRGDAIAGMCIIAINIIAGISIGLYAGTRTLPEIGALYTRLTIGDGLVSQIPAFLVAVAAAILVTRGSRASDLPGTFMEQIFSRPSALLVTAAFLLCLAFTPLPPVPLAILGTGCVAAAWVLDVEAKKRQKLAQETKIAQEKAEKAEAQKNIPVEKLLHVDAVEIELGEALIPLTFSENAESAFNREKMAAGTGANVVSGTTGSEPPSRFPHGADVPLLSGRSAPFHSAPVPAAMPKASVKDTFSEETLTARIRKIREKLARELGFIFPSVRICDAPDLAPHEYRVRINDSPVAQNTLRPGMLLAVERGIITGPIPGLKTRDFLGTDTAVWISPQHAEQAAEYGYTVLTHPEILAEHLLEIAKKFAPELLSRDAAQHLLDELQKTSPVAVGELVPKKMSVLEVQKVLRLLLRERVSIRRLAIILETLGENISLTADPISLAESVRTRLGRAITAEHLDVDGTLFAMTLDPAVETLIRNDFSRTADGITLHLPPRTGEAILRTVHLESQKLRLMNRKAVLLTSAALRPVVSELLRQHDVPLPVLSYQEIPPETRVEMLHGIKILSEAA